MKTFKISVASVFLDCPNCGESIPHPTTGSHLWENNDPVRERSIKCEACGERGRVPKSLQREEDQ
jgi:DNA-directed RNA polymerase subunit RPC12/RpoP